MQENAVDSPPIAEEQQPDVSSPEASDPPELAFSDAATATRWVKSLPLSNVGQAYQAILDQLRALTASQMGPRDRATIAELIREPVAHLHTELARRYAGKPQPLDEREAEAADQAIALWQALWIQYSVCLKPLLEGSTELQGVKAKLLQRALYVGKQLIIVHGCARRIPSADLWQELHAYYRLAEMLDCAMASVSDHLMPDAEGLSCYSTYSHGAAAGARRPLCAECAADRAHRSLAGPVVAQGVSLRQAARERRCRSSSSTSKRTHGAVLANSSAGTHSAIGALRLSGEARDERSRPAEAARQRRDAGRAATRRRRVDRSGRRRC